LLLKAETCSGITVENAMQFEKNTVVSDASFSSEINVKLYTMLGSWV
jgi:hypothetical protein